MKKPLTQLLALTLFSLVSMNIAANEALFKGLPFNATPSTQLHFAKRTANSVVLIDKAPYDTSLTVTPLLIISSLNNEQTVNDRVAFSKQQLNKAENLQDITIKTEKAMTIAGIRAYQIIADATDKQTSQKVIVYQAIAFQPNRFLLIQGLAGKSQAERFLPQFNQITDSVSFKKGG